MDHAGSASAAAAPAVDAAAAVPAPEPLPVDARGRPVFVSVRSLGTRGGLGTQLFQMAAAIAVARDHGVPYVFPPWKYEPHFHLAGCFRDVPEPTHVWQESGFRHAPVEFRPRLDLRGLFQSEKYFAHHADFVRAALRPRALVAPEPGTCSIHVRRGDFLARPERQPILGLDYYLAAADVVGDARFLVFSDDPGWCAKLFRAPRFTVVRTQPDHVHFAAMASCESHILADSAFSWWAAWLGAGAAGRVVAPHRRQWFGEAGAGVDTSDLYPAGWIEVEVRSRARRAWVRAAPCPVPEAAALAAPAATDATAARADCDPPRDAGFPRILYGVTACMKGRERAAALLETWARWLPPRDQLVLAADARVAEVLAATVWPCVEAGGPDDCYQALTFKTRELLRRALEVPGWDFFVKADDDTWVFPERLSAALAEYDPAEPFFGGGGGLQPQSGNPVLGEPFLFFCGGSGYVLSRPALERAWPMLQAELTRRASAEDVAVGAGARRAGIEATELAIDMLRGGGLTTALETAVATVHYCGPREMRLIFDHWTGRRPPFAVAARRVAWGRVGMGGSLGYQRLKVTLDGQPMENALSAHAPSALLLRAPPGLRLELQGILNDTASSTAQAQFEIRTRRGELLAEPATATRRRATPPVVVRFPADGRLLLLARTAALRRCHTVWLWQPV